mgnify:CR=1 FL=1
MAIKLLYLGISKKGAIPTSIKTLGKYFEYEGVKVYRSRLLRFKIFTLIYMLYKVICLNKKIDFILIDTYSTSAFWYSYLNSRLAYFFKIPYIPILRGGDLPHRLKSHPKLCQHIFKNSKTNVVPSKFLESHFKDAGYYNLTYIPNTIPIKNYSFKKRDNLSPKILWVRAFAEIYNPILALQVLQQLIEKYPHAELSMVGPFKDDTINVCKSYAQQHDLPVTFTGALPKEEWLEYAENFDIFINTTNVDNTPVSVIEAMALGLPVVTTNVGGIPYLLEDKKDALLVPKNNAEAMLQSIQYLLDHPSFVEKVTKQARSKVERFDWEKVKYKWFQILSHDS